MPEINIKEVKEELGKTFDEFKKTVDLKAEEAEKRNGEATAETREKVDTINGEITKLSDQIKEFEKRMARPGGPQEGKTEDPDKELRASAYEKYLRHGMGETAMVIMSPEEKRALAGTSDADGGFLVPDDFESQLIMNAYDMAEIRPLVRAGTTSRDVVKMGSLSKPVVEWGTRGLSVTEQDLSAGGVRVPIKNVRALTLISNDTLDDAAADIMGELQTAFQMAVAEAEDDAFIAGTDPDEPSGILANAGVLANVTNSGVAAAIADATHNGVDALKSMLYALKKTYRRNATWAMNSATEGLYRQLKDGDGQYLWDPKTETAGAPTLLGYKLVNPEGMPDVGANAYPVLFGDFNSGYRVYDRAGMTISRLVERYAEYDQTGLMIKKRVGGNVALSEAFRCLKISA